MVTLVSELQNRKAPSPISVTLSGMVMLVREMHLAKASPSIIFTLSGMAISLTDSQESKVDLPIIVTGFPSILFGIITFLSEPLYLPIRISPSFSSYKNNSALAAIDSSGLLEGAVGLVDDVLEGLLAGALVGVEEVLVGVSVVVDDVADELPSSDVVEEVSLSEVLEELPLSDVVEEVFFSEVTEELLSFGVPLSSGVPQPVSDSASAAQMIIARIFFFIVTFFLSFSTGKYTQSLF